MKKTAILTLALVISSITIYAQANKPGANSFGIQYGISYGGTLNQSLILSGWLDKGIEVRGGTLLNFSYNNSRTGNVTDINTGGGSISGYNSSQSKSGTITVTPNISLLKHFDTHSNIDPFVGGLMSTGISIQTIQTQSVNETTGENYDHYISSSTKNPIITTLGVSLVGGVNYFFAKNFAIGVDVGFGFSTAFSNGKKYTNNIERNSGTANNNKNNSATTNVSDIQTNSASVNLSGNGGLRFTYYIKTKATPVMTVNPKF